MIPKSQSKPITLHIRITRAERASLRKLEKAARMSYSQICRAAISEYVGRMLDGRSK